MYVGEVGATPRPTLDLEVVGAAAGLPVTLVLVVCHQALRSTAEDEVELPEVALPLLGIQEVEEQLEHVRKDRPAARLDARLDDGGTTDVGSLEDGLDGVLHILRDVVFWVEVVDQHVDVLAADQTQIRIVFRVSPLSEDSTEDLRGDRPDEATEQVARQRGLTLRRVAREEGVQIGHGDFLGQESLGRSTGGQDLAPPAGEDLGDSNRPLVLLPLLAEQRKERPLHRTDTGCQLHVTQVTPPLVASGLPAN